VLDLTTALRSAIFFSLAVLRASLKALQIPLEGSPDGSIWHIGGTLKGKPIEAFGLISITKEIRSKDLR